VMHIIKVTGKIEREKTSQKYLNKIEISF
jgi:hypothetical protein